MGLCVEHLDVHPKGQVLNMPCSKPDEQAKAQLVVLPTPLAPRTARFSLSATGWRRAMSAPARFRPVRHNGITVRPNAMTEAAVNRAVQRACTGRPALRSRTLPTLSRWVRHLPAQRGASDRAIAHQTRHRSLAILDAYIRVENAWTDNAATILDLRRPVSP